MPSCICGSFFSVPIYKSEIKESIELCRACIQSSTPSTYVNREYVQGSVCDDSNSLSAKKNSE